MIEALGGFEPSGIGLCGGMMVGMSHNTEGHHFFDGSRRVSKVWDRIAEVLPADDINGPASEEAVGELESHLGTSLPRELRESLLLHDGTRDAQTSFNLFGGWLLSVAEITATWDMWVKVAEQSDVFFEKSWLPVSADGAGNGFSVDLDTGRVFDLDHEVGASEAKADTWVEFLTMKVEQHEEQDSDG